MRRLRQRLPPSADVRTVEDAGSEQVCDNRLAQAGQSAGGDRAETGATSMADISHRKTDHLDLATHGDVAFKATTTLVECVRLVR
jgi:hypothetical protein